MRSPVLSPYYFTERKSASAFGILSEKLRRKPFGRFSELNEFSNGGITVCPPWGCSGRGNFLDRCCITKKVLFDVFVMTGLSCESREPRFSLWGCIKRPMERAIKNLGT